MNPIARRLIVVVGAFVTLGLMVTLFTWLWPEEGPTAGFWTWAVMVAAAGIGYILRHINVLKPVPYIMGVVAVIWLFFMSRNGNSEYRVNSISAGTWSEAMVIVSLPPQTKPGSESQIRDLIEATIPTDFKARDGNPGHEECLQMQLKALWADDIDALRVARSQCLAAYETYRLRQLSNTFRPDHRATLIVAGIHMFIAVLGIKSRKIPMIGRITLAPMAIGIYALMVTLLPIEAYSAAWDLMLKAVGLRVLGTVVSVIALVWGFTGDSLNAEARSRRPIGRWAIAIIVASVTGIFGIDPESMFQFGVIAEAVTRSGAHLVASDAWMLYQFASLGGTFFGALIATGMLYARSTRQQMSDER